jgi:glycine/D-amino acid oxidase-like deaminating enzyme
VRIAVIGAGITGLSVAFHLAERGADVVVHERTGVAAEASGVQPGGVRQQWSTRVNCLLARESIGFYRDLVERLEPRTTPSLDACGYLFLAHSQQRLDRLAADVALQNDAGVPSELVAPDELAQLLPGLDVSQVTGAAYCAEDGYFDQPQAVVEAFAEACRRRGVAIERSTVTALVAEPTGWSLERLDADDAVADVVVVAAGYDSPALLTGLGTEVPISKQPRYLLLSDPIRERLVEPLVVSAERRFAAKHLVNGRVLASDLAADGDPDGNANVWRANVRATARQLLPVLEFVAYPIVVEGFYDVTPDHQPLIGPLSGHDGLWLAAGFSGHGFMIAPAVGRILAEALLDGRHDSVLDSFALDRFERGNLVPELQIV